MENVISLGYTLATELFIDRLSAIWSTTEGKWGMGMLTIGHLYSCFKATGTLACAHNVENSLRSVSNLFPKKSHPQVAFSIITLKVCFISSWSSSFAYCLSFLVSTQPAVIDTLFSHFIVENLRFREVKNLGQGHVDSKQQMQSSLCYTALIHKLIIIKVICNKYLQQSCLFRSLPQSCRFTLIEIQWLSDQMGSHI